MFQLPVISRLSQGVAISPRIDVITIQIELPVSAVCLYKSQSATRINRATATISNDQSMVAVNLPIHLHKVARQGRQVRIHDETARTCQIRFDMKGLEITLRRKQHSPLVVELTQIRVPG
ncbi:hypothetical protein A7D27_07330 [Pseudomonas sp. 1D4]|nr:hypothetical protein A7D27_07330 [Pseudomonas sp. 1D4]OEC61971.1 hypothetical protein A9G05_00525 [Pseudomonas sp. ENNP23]